MAHEEDTRYEVIGNTGTWRIWDHDRQEVALPTSPGNYFPSLDAAIASCQKLNRRAAAQS